MPSLFVSLGTSPAIVPEAFLLPGANFSAVHVLTTVSPKISLVQEFFQEHHPTVALHITRVEGFEDFRGEEDHFHFEEVLYRWILASRTPPSERWFCLSGGFKTMSAAVQKAAGYLGAAEVFHVLADPLDQTAEGRPRPPATAPEILAAAAAGHLHYIRLGGESGWPQFAHIPDGAFPLTEHRSEAGVHWVSAPDQSFRGRLGEVVERSHRIAGCWENLSALPFPTLATWSGSELAWLEQPVDPEKDRAWVQALPKVELHCHLGGFATAGELLAQVRSAALDPKRLPDLRAPDLPSQWPLPTRPISLSDYMRLGDANGSALLRDPGCLREQCRLLYQHLRRENVLHAEIRCSPANYADPARSRSPLNVLLDIKSTFDACMKSDPGTSVHLLLIATRREKGDYRAAIARHLALAVTAAEHWSGEEECRVVGVDLAGYEDRTTRAHYYREEFTAVHRCGLALTAHAGENDDVEGIWRAVFDLNARRLGHALHLAGSPELLRSVADRGITVEMCPYANLQIKGFAPISEDQDGRPQPAYPLKQYLDSGVRVTVNTDNIGISGASLTDNLLLAARLCPNLTRLDLLRLLRYAIDGTFLATNLHSRLLARTQACLPTPF